MIKAINSWLRKNPVTTLTISYITGLAILAGMSIGAHLVVSHVIEQQKDTARVVNVAGRQRMLSQRTALFASNLVHQEGKEAFKRNQEKLSNSLYELQSAHNSLIHGNSTLRINSTLPDNVAAVYFEAPHHLDKHVKQYLVDLQSLLAIPQQELSASNSLYQRIYSHAEGPLLKLLHAAVVAYEADAEQKIANLTRIQKASIFVVIVVIFLEALLIFKPLIRRVKNHTANMERAATTDMLTNVANRWSVNKALDNAMLTARRKGTPLSVIICDIDNFKKVNDTYGHNIGDIAIKHVAKTMEECARDKDIIGRLGGEEFVVILPETDDYVATVIAEKIRNAIDKATIPLPNDKDTENSLNFTVSLGVTAYRAEKLEDIDDFLNRADKALYAAKQTGKNRYEVV